MWVYVCMCGCDHVARVQLCVCVCVFQHVAGTCACVLCVRACMCGIMCKIVCVYIIDNVTSYCYLWMFYSSASNCVWLYVSTMLIFITTALSYNLISGRVMTL